MASRHVQEASHAETMYDTRYTSCTLTYESNTIVGVPPTAKASAVLPFSNSTALNSWVGPAFPPTINGSRNVQSN